MGAARARRFSHSKWASELTIFLTKVGLGDFGPPVAANWRVFRQLVNLPPAGQSPASWSIFRQLVNLPPTGESVRAAAPRKMDAPGGTRSPAPGSNREQKTVP